MSSTPNLFPLENLTVTRVEALVQLVVTVCKEPVVIDWVLVWPRLSESVNVPAVLAKTFSVFKIRGAGLKVKLREEPEPEEK